MTDYFAGVDVGGTTIKAGIVDSSGKLRSSASVSTESARGPHHGLAQIRVAIDEACRAAAIELSMIQGIGLATPGPLDIGAGMILEPPNLKSWRQFPIRAELEGLLALPVVLQNDANAAAYGEFRAGAGRGSSSIVMFTLGTGIGCGIVIDGRLLEGRHSHGAECGHLRIEVTRPRACTCGRAGCLEAYASATAVVERAREALAGNSRSALMHLMTDELTCEAVFQAAAGQDALAVRIVDETSYYLAIGAVNLMHTIDPDMVIFGGGMMAAGPDFLERIAAHIRREAFPVPAAKTVIRAAQLGNDAGIIGAAAWVQASLAARNES